MDIVLLLKLIEETEEYVLIFEQSDVIKGATNNNGKCENNSIIETNIFLVAIYAITSCIYIYIYLTVLVFFLPRQDRTQVYLRRSISLLKLSNE